MDDETKKKLNAVGKKTLAAGKISIGAARIASAVSAYAAISTTMPFLERIIRRGLVQKGAEGGWNQMKKGLEDWNEPE